MFSLIADAAREPNKSFPIPLLEMFGGGALILKGAFTSNSFVREGKIGASDLNKFSPKLKDGASGGGLGPPSKKSSIVGKLGGPLPGPKRFELLLILLLLLLLLLLLFEKEVFIPLSLSNLFLISNSFLGWLGSDLIKSLSDCFFFYIYFSQQTSYYWIFCIECRDIFKNKL